MIDPDKNYYASGIIPGHGMLMADQLVDSEIATTREFWRAKAGLPEHIVKDPRKLAEIPRKLAEIEFGVE